MSSVHSITVVPAGLDPFARRRTVTNPATGQSSSPAPLTGPTTVTVSLGTPGPPGPPGEALPADIDPVLLFENALAGHD